MIKNASSSPEAFTVSCDAGAGSSPSWTDGSTSLTFIVKGVIPSGTEINNKHFACFFDHELYFISNRIDLQNEDGAFVRANAGSEANSIIADLATGTTTRDEKFVLAITLDVSGGTGNHTLSMRWVTTTTYAADPASVITDSQTRGADGLATTRNVIGISGGDASPQNNLNNIANLEVSGAIVVKAALSDAELIDIFEYDKADWWLRGTDYFLASNGNTANIVAILGFSTFSGFDSPDAGGTDTVIGYLEEVSSADRATSPSMISDSLDLINTRGDNPFSYIEPTTSSLAETVDDLTLRLDPADQAAFVTAQAGTNQFMYDWLGAGTGEINGGMTLMVGGNSRGSRTISDASGTSHGLTLFQNYAGGVISHELAEGNPVGGIVLTDFTWADAGETTARTDFFTTGRPTTATDASGSNAALAKFGSGGQSRNHQGTLIGQDEVWCVLAHEDNVSTRLVKTINLLCCPGASTDVTLRAVQADDAAGTNQTAATLLSTLSSSYTMQDGVAAPSGGPIAIGDGGSTLSNVPLDTTVATLNGPSANDDAAKAMTIDTGLSGVNEPQPGQIMRLVGGNSAGYTNEVVSYDSGTGVVTLKHFWESHGETLTSGTPRDVSDATGILLGGWGILSVTAEFDLSVADPNHGIEVENAATGDCYVLSMWLRDPGILGPSVGSFGKGGDGYERQINQTVTDAHGLFFETVGTVAVDFMGATQGETTPGTNLKTLVGLIQLHLPNCDFSFGWEPISNSGDNAAGGSGSAFILNGATGLGADVDGTLDGGNQYAAHRVAAADFNFPFAHATDLLGSYPSQMPRAYTANGPHPSVRGHEAWWAGRRSRIASVVEARPTSSGGTTTTPSSANKNAVVLIGDSLRVMTDGEPITILMDQDVVNEYLQGLL
jgi:hypothetical protein